MLEMGKSIWIIDAVSVVQALTIHMDGLHVLAS